MVKVSLRLTMALSIAGVLAASGAMAQSSTGNPRKPDGTIQKPGAPAGSEFDGPCYYTYVWTNVTTKGTVSNKSGYRRREVVDSVCTQTSTGPGMVE